MAENKKSPEDLLAEITALQEKYKAAEEAKQALLDSNTELQSQLEESQKTVEKILTVVSDGKQKYEFIGKAVQFKGKKYTAQELAEDKEAVAHLVKIKSGLLKQL